MKTSVLITALALSLPALAASAQSFTIYNTTSVEGSNGLTYAAPQNYIGPAYQTLSMTVSQTGSTATMTYLTAFDGNEDVAGYTIGYADVFFGGLMSGYAVSMGDQTKNGGVAAGFYQVQGVKTSQDIWGGRNNVVFGADYGPDAVSAATVLDGGTFMASMVLNETHIDSGANAGFYDVSFTLDNLPFNLMQAFEDGSVWAFWGTGDCANGAFLAAVAVPEPGVLAIYVIGLAALIYARRRRTTKE